MPRAPRAAAGGICYHVINRANRRDRVFHESSDYLAFVQLIADANGRVGMRVLAYCLMPNHFHFVVWPHGDHDIGRWMHWFSTTHAVRYHRRHETSGHLWQGRFKAFPIEEDHHLITVIRYVERNPVRASLVERAEQWPWSSLSRRGLASGVLHPGPVSRPPRWLSWVNQPQTSAEVDALRTCVSRGRPFGCAPWTQRIAEDLGVESSLRPRGRPRKTRG